MFYKFTALFFLINTIAIGYSLRCLSCNSLFNDNCASNFLKMATILCDEEGEECATFVDTNSTIYRGCSSEMEEDVLAFNSCNSTDLCNNRKVCLENPKCIFCDSKYCSDDEESYYQSCIECDSTNEEECRVVNPEQSVTCVRSHNLGCYHYEKENMVKRGCLSHLSKDDSLFQDCEKGINCKTCIGNDCNSKEELQKCFSCNSADNSACATLKSDLPIKICDEYFDTCKVYVKPNSTTHRGCSNEIIEPGLECSSQTVNCKECQDNLCNGGVFPANRLTCYVCKGFTSSDCALSVKEDMIQPCENYYFRDSCYLLMDKNNLTVRGCLSDSDSFRFSDLCLALPEQCEICQTPNCNKKSVIQKPSLSCIKCDTSTDPKCLWGFIESSKTACYRNVMHYEEESCFTFQISDKSIIRGCTLDSNICKGSNKCQICKENGCNNERKIAQYCIECNSEDDRKCLDQPSSLRNISCDGNIVFEYRGCYTWKGDNNQISRGCFSQLSAAKKFECMNDREHCEICHQNDSCNVNPKNSSHRFKVHLYLVIFSSFGSFVFLL